MAWITANWGIVAAVLLTVSEALAMIFPSSTGFGGILAGVIKVLKGAGIKDASGQ